MPAPIELLQSVPLFQSLGKKELEMLSRTFVDRTFPAGREITAEGGGGVGFFLIESGSVAVSVGGVDRGTLGPGEHFGEIALIDGGTRTATLTAVTDVKCYGLTPWEFRPLVENNAAIAWPLLQQLAARLREAQAEG